MSLQKNFTDHKRRDIGSTSEPLKSIIINEALLLDAFDGTLNDFIGSADVSQCDFESSKQNCEVIIFLNDNVWKKG